MENEYEIGKWYKIETFEKLHFTGVIIQETENKIKFDTIRNEQILWDKKDIKRAIKMDGDF